MTPKALRSALCLVLVSLLTHAARSQANDNWQNAIAISDGLTAGTNVGATTGSPVGSCGLMGQDVWYSYVATCTGTATASTCPPGTATFDTVVATWFAPLPCGTPRPGQISCSDDACGTVRSSATFSVLAGHTYYISVGGFAGAAGSFTLSVSCAASAGPAPANNTCANAVTLNSSALVTATNVGATSGLGDPVPAFPCNAMAKDVWYSFVAPQTQSFVVTTCLPGTDFDTMITVWTGAGCGSLAQIVCSDDDCYIGGGSLRSTVRFNAAGGATYFISVGGYLGAAGYFNLLLSPIDAMDLFVNSSAPGNIGFSVTHGPPNGVYFAAFTGNAGNFPNGWFLGIDIGAGDLGQQLLGGFPFWGVLDACGNASVGPFNGLPSGVALYGVAVGFVAGQNVPVVVSPPDSDVIQ